MARALLVILFSVLLFTGATYAQATDTLATAATDTAIQQPTALDTTKYINVSSAQSLLVNGNKVVSNDIEQYNPSKRNGAAFVILMILLAAVTYLKTSFSKDLEELLQSVVNQNLSQQIFRSRSNEVSFASVLLNLNFIIVFSLYIRFIL